MTAITRRAFLQRGAMFSAAIAIGQNAMAAEPDAGLRIGLFTDLHHADKEPNGTRHYRDAIEKLSVILQQFKKDKVDLTVELGDLIDSAASLETEKDYLRTVAKTLAAAPGRHGYVIGNHCVENLTKPEFLEIVGQAKPYYSFDLKGYHLVFLDACFRSDGQPYGRKNAQWSDANIPPAEAEWLKADLQETSLKTLVFIHQPLDVDTPYAVRNAAAIRTILENSGKVLAAVQGHVHRNCHRTIGGIPYVTLAAAVEEPYPENAYAVLDVLPGDLIRITGFGSQKSYDLCRDDGTLT